MIAIVEPLEHDLLFLEDLLLLDQGDLSDRVPAVLIDEVFLLVQVLFAAAVRHHQHETHLAKLQATHLVVHRLRFIPNERISPNQYKELAHRLRVKDHQ